LFAQNISLVERDVEAREAGSAPAFMSAHGAVFASIGAPIAYVSTARVHRN
jgi:hypothetical protein